MKVRAKSYGTFKGLRVPGEVFEYDGITEKTVGGKKAAYFPSWMEPLEKPAARKPSGKAAATKQEEPKQDAGDSGEKVE